MSTKLLLAAILILGFLLRFYQPCYLGEFNLFCATEQEGRVLHVPPSLNWDEVAIGYNAYSIFKTGRDEWGNSFPVHFKSYGEYKLPVQIYASIPAIAIFGLNEFSIRLTPLLYGLLTVLFTFFLARDIFKSNKIGLIAAFLLAISPWHIHLTRASFEASFAAFWVILGLWFLVKGFEKKIYLIYSMIPLAISIYTYNSARVFVPLFLIIVLVIYRKTFWKVKKIVLISMVVFAALMIPLLPYYLSGEGNSRYKLVSITDEPGLIPRINENRGLSTLPNPLPRLVHNKVTYLSFYFVKNYLSHFSPQYLFWSGAPHKQHHVQGIGQLYLFQAPFFFLGLYLLFKEKQKFRGLLLSWILLIFIPVSVTNDSIPHALRTVIAVPFYQLITGFGLYKFYEVYLKRGQFKTFTFVLGVVIVISLGLYLNNYYNKYPYFYSRDWQYGNKQVVEYIKTHYSEYDEIVFTRHYGEPHMFTLFYTQYDPAKYQTNPNLIRFETNDWVRVLRFDKYYFPDLGDDGTRYKDIVELNSDKKMLFIGKPTDLPPEIPRLAKINFLDGSPAFEIVEYKP